MTALPPPLLLLFHRRDERPMPQVREWMNSPSRAVEAATCLIFVALVLCPGSPRRCRGVRHRSPCMATAAACREYITSAQITTTSSAMISRDHTG